MHFLSTLYIEYAVSLVIATVVAFPFLLLNCKFAHRLGLIDWPKARGLAEEQIPIIGHSIVALSILFLIVAKLLFPSVVGGAFLCTAIGIAVMGVLDDRRPLPALDKMLFQIVLVVCLVLFDPYMRNGLTAQFGPFGTFCAIFFILGLMNAVNFIDGIDGLAGLVLLVGSAGFILVGRKDPNLQLYLTFTAALIGMLIPFLFLNVVQRRGFLGNTGSYFFSFVLGYIHLVPRIEAHDAISRLSLSGLFFLIPISDAGMVLLSRMITRRSPFQADKGHLHHRLIQTALPLRYVLLTFALIDFVGLVTGYTLLHSGAMKKSIFPFVTLLSHMCVVGYLIVFVEKATKRRVQSYFQHLDNGQVLYFLKYKVSKADGSEVPRYLLNRLCANVNSEIRVTDICYIEEPNVLFVGLKSMDESLKGIFSRLEAIFNKEKLNFALEVERGEFVKVAAPTTTTIPLRRVK